MLERIYVEIGNICNLSCSFCPGTSREKKQMTPSDFSHICSKIKGHTENIYLHVMGEPLLHPRLSEIIDLGAEYGFRVSVTTNGTLIKKYKEKLTKHGKNLYKVNISLHAPEGNGIFEGLEEYISSAQELAKELSDMGVFTVFRLWNENSAFKSGENSVNERIKELLLSHFPEPWINKGRGIRLYKNIFLEYDGVFLWPSETQSSLEYEREKGRCHGLLRQIAILADGTVVPCCLDSEGVIALGNIFSSELSDILNSKRALDMKKGLLAGKFTEPLCRSCTFSRRFGN